MTRHLILYNLILALHSWQDRAEPWDEWELRADTIAEAIDVSGATNEEAAVLTYLAWHEGKNARDVQRGKVTRRGKKHYFSLWQIDTDWGPAMWMVGTDQTKWSAVAALDIFRQHRGHGTLIDGLRGYGGYSRWSPTPRLMARRIRAIEKQLDKATSEGTP
jgi:hypothetical protein